MESPETAICASHMVLRRPVLFLLHAPFWSEAKASYEASKTGRMPG